MCGVPDTGMETESRGPRAGRGYELVGFSPAPMFLLRDSPPRPSPPPVRAPWQPPLRIPVKERLTFQAAGGPGASVFSSSALATEEGTRVEELRAATLCPQLRPVETWPAMATQGGNTVPALLAMHLTGVHTRLW